MIDKTARNLTVKVATYLATEIASLFRPILSHPQLVLYDNESEPLLTSKFWVRPLYQELLHAASRFNATAAGELKRPISRMVKILTHQRAMKQQNANISAPQATIREWIRAECDFLNVWFPAHWVPTVMEALEEKARKYRNENLMWFDAPARSDDPPNLVQERKEALQSRKVRFQCLSLGEDDDIPTLTCLTGSIGCNYIPVDDLLQQFVMLKEGICRGVFRQKAAGAWFGVRAERAQVTVIFTWL